MSDSTGSHVMPRSLLLNRPAGATPAHTTFGVFACPGSMCHVRRNVLRCPFGNAGLLAKSGPSVVHRSRAPLDRKRYAPFFVPTMTTTPFFTVPLLSPRHRRD